MTAFNTHSQIAAFHNNLAGRVSDCFHEMAQPLTALQGILELSLLTAETVHEYRESVERALSEVARVIDCIQQTRAVAADSFNPHCG